MANSLYDIPPGCICMGDGLMGMRCPSKEHATLKTPPQFSTAADLILDAVEDAFGIVAPNGRDITKKAIISILKYYCLPREAQVQDQ